MKDKAVHHFVAGFFAILTAWILFKLAGQGATLLCAA